MNLKPLIPLCFCLATTPSFADSDQEALAENLADYFDFAAYSDGVITPNDIAQFDNLYFIDTRKPEHYETSHIKGAVNIEWREILSNLDEIPAEQTVVLYCDTGYLSSKAHMALKLMGRENVRVLFGGYNNWLISQNK